MTPYVTITLPGEPKGKARPRFTKTTGKVYTTKDTRAYEEALGMEARLAMRGKKIVETPCRVDVKAFFTIPKSWSKLMRGAALDEWVLPVGKPDADNILKTLDGLNAIVFCDDRQVVDARIRKFYAAEPKLIIEVYPIAEYRRDAD